MQLNKSNVSNSISFLALLIGLIGDSPRSSWLLAAGLFGFAGGITNGLAVKMLFDRVPWLYGSGVIPARFREIREGIKDLIMRHFFTPEKIRRKMIARIPEFVPYSEFVVDAIDVDALHGHIDDMLTETLLELTPQTVKEMTEEMIREHLGWLIVWGNVFGACMGLTAKVLGY